MTATKEQPNQRASQPQQDEVGNYTLFPLICVILPLYPRTPSGFSCDVSAYLIVFSCQGGEVKLVPTLARVQR